MNGVYRIEPLIMRRMSKRSRRKSNLDKNYSIFCRKQNLVILHGKTGKDKRVGCFICFWVDIQVLHIVGLLARGFFLVLQILN